MLSVKQFAKNKLLVIAAAAALLYALYNYDFGKKSEDMLEQKGKTTKINRNGSTN